MLFFLSDNLFTLFFIHSVLFLWQEWIAKNVVVDEVIVFEKTFKNCICLRLFEYPTTVHFTTFPHAFVGVARWPCYFSSAMIMTLMKIALINCTIRHNQLPFPRFFILIQLSLFINEIKLQHIFVTAFVFTNWYYKDRHHIHAWQVYFWDW